MNKEMKKIVLSDIRDVRKLTDEEIWRVIVFLRRQYLRYLHAHPDRLALILSRKEQGRGREVYISPHTGNYMQEQELMTKDTPEDLCIDDLEKGMCYLDYTIVAFTCVLTERYNEIYSNRIDEELQERSALW